MKIKHLPLNSEVTDSATGLRGRLVHLQFELNDIRFYNFQPRGLNPEDGQPVRRFWVVPSRVLKAPAEIESEIPLEVLGTKATDDASGFTGTVTAITLHPSGCVHVLIQPAGTLAKTGSAIAAEDFDLRRVSGPAIPKLTPKEIAAEEKRAPSPSPCGRPGPGSL